MNEQYIVKIAEELSIYETQVAAAATLLSEGATVPFISRYRKEMTGSLDEVAVTAIRDRLKQLEELDKRRESILASLEERDLLTDELKEKILNAETMSKLEDIYLPYRPKRRTRATIAKEKGLEPLADLLFEQENIEPEEEAAAYIDPEKELETADDCLAGARDIIAERVNEDEECRTRMRKLFLEDGMISSRVIPGKEDEGAKFRDYYEWQEPVNQAKSHRILALMRGEKELMLFLEIEPEKEKAIELMDSLFVKAENPASEHVKTAIRDGYSRLLSPSMETETRIELKRRADTEAITVFAENLRQILLSPPLGQKSVLALDPGFRTGCKTVCLDRQGKLLHNDTIFPHSGDTKRIEAGKSLIKLVKQYDIEVIAIGSGTASRETESFVRDIDFGKTIPVVIVNESGASIYSASEAAREEFPDYDVTVRGAVSIGRRLMDPLAELVKIDPKSIGVGQYQHDVDQGGLKDKLDDVVISCVNNVGVELNTASHRLLAYVSGIGPKLAWNIVEYRNQNGAFNSRKDLKDVKGLGPKAFEQSAGFLRIRDAKNPLDTSAVHPESYHVVDSMAKDLGCSVSGLMTDSALRNKINIKKYVTDTVGIPTLEDILSELAKPGRDPRQNFEIVSFAEDVHELEDLKPGMKVPGIVTNVTRFGAFVDVGVHQDGLIHISELADKFVKNPADIVSVGQNVMVTVLEVDPARRRISLSLKQKRTE